MNKTIAIPIQRILNEERFETEDFLAIEEPLEIKLSFVKDSKQIEKTVSITMRTPGNDEELVMGFLFTEGILQNAGDILSVKVTGENKITVFLKENLSFDLSRLERNFYTSSSCGVCGKTSIEAIHTIVKPNVQIAGEKFNIELLYSLPEALLKHQEVFEKTGGLHASALFTSEGELILTREDVGRHNALDKLIGTLLMKNLSPNNCILLLSGRASFELVQKSAMAGINTIASVGAPSSLAYELAKESGMTLIGFLKNNRFNIYCGSERLIQHKILKVEN